MPETPTQSVVIQPASTPPLSVNLTLLAEWAAAVIAISAVVALLLKLLTKMIGSEIGDVRRDVGEVKHKVNNTAEKVNALERLRTTDVERIVRLEVAYANVEKGFDRIEKRLGDEFGQLAQSVREIRDVRPRGDRA